MRDPREYVTDEAEAAFVKDRHEQCAAARSDYYDVREALEAATPFIVDAAYKDGYDQAIADAVEALRTTDDPRTDGDGPWWADFIEQWATARKAAEA